MIELHDEVLVNLRRIMRASDMYSRRLKRESGLTTPQLVILNTLKTRPYMSVKEISHAVNLSQATVTSILNRLEQTELITRSKSKEDRRRLEVALSSKGETALKEAPRALQEEFVQGFQELPTWEQHMLVAALSKIAEMMHAEEIDAAPVLSGEVELSKT